MPKGHPLTLLAQLSFKEMPALEDYPRKGLLPVFISNEDSREPVWWSTTGTSTEQGRVKDMNKAIARVYF
ncbi:MAG TPA: DUF1963 domain-containing protein [Thermoanaerobaculia bacterium]|nr:DUF1963 domain-containing protein [Thermoanaerobaculia bacterium]